MGGLAGRAVPLGTTAAPTSRQKFGKVSLLALYLIQSRDDAVQDAFFEDYKRRDILWLSQTWAQLISHLVKIENRHAPDRHRHPDQPHPAARDSHPTARDSHQILLQTAWG